MTAQPATAYSGGFQNAAIDAARAFRVAMTVMARPGDIGVLDGAEPPQPLPVAQAVLMLTLCDAETPVFLAGATDCAAVRDWLRFHTGAPLVGPGAAMFAVGTWQDLMPLEAYSVGTPEYPDRSATLIAEVPRLAAEGARLTGPGIETQSRLSLPDAAALARNAMHYPLGLDFFFTCGERVAALPRSTRITPEE